MSSQLTFIGFTTEAIHTVVNAYPNAKFHGAIGNIPGGGSSPDPRALTQWIWDFNDGITMNAIVIQSAGTWGELKSPVYVPHRANSGLIVPWPITLDIIDASQVLRNAGFNQPYTSVALRWPIAEPGYTQPYYIFSFTQGLPQGVGVNDRSIHQF
jgi:hypothetical protein